MSDILKREFERKIMSILDDFSRWQNLTDNVHEIHIVFRMQKGTIGYKLFNETLQRVHFVDDSGAK